ncbi:DUF4189 domain-containing protein [Nocardia coubleae]|uniref:DUF4189 domain-containing protein n=1 Tax=Nocardia coubleae TaxID=356147 RepID=A0A846WB71_9NOCA|nr:DUF4189 domain-containing protein [Nocardia coubleae]NKX89850.1 DUF4189 domain-containing protein [Nocardia coubleae]
MSFMGKAGFAVAALGLAAGSVFGAGTANAQSMFGAIAFSTTDWTYGSSSSWPSEQEAREQAIASCGTNGAADCKVMISWANGCGTLVVSDDGVAAASGRTAAEATRAAFERLSELTPTAQLANFGSSDLSGAKVARVVCTANAR